MCCAQQAYGSSLDRKMGMELRIRQSGEGRQGRPEDIQTLAKIQDAPTFKPTAQRWSIHFSLSASDGVSQANSWQA